MIDHVEMMAASTATRRGTERHVVPDPPAPVRPLADRPRTIVTIDSAFDDPPSLIGLLLFSTEIRLEAIVHPDNPFVGKALDKYEDAYPNLSAHDQRYPDPDYVRSLERDTRGVDGGVSPAAELIADILLGEENGPVYLQVWEGGGSVEAALGLIEERHGEDDDWDSIRSSVSSKAIITTLVEPESVFGGALLEAWPDLRIVEVTSDLWTYPHMLPLISPGLRGHEHPSYGGWGGRARPIDEDLDTWTVEGVSDRADEEAGVGPEGETSVSRWFDDAQADFAERVRWSTTPEYAEGNHHPEIEVTTGLDVEVRAGGRVALIASVSDPDGDDVSIHWWHYREASTYRGPIEVSEAGEVARVQVPESARPGDTIHIVVEATDDAERPLKTYRRVILTVG
ncbi:nucleoside hydrolase-like domain-containing protein [Microbacterium sp. C7(2022)]|uniref:nucleoside hydrolase-like domain-containing protein n=1 Tax=Microbacterium sp. C7(2022) TaxID=2992759 RepID=UPI00237B5D1F|nr:nucleoside hydrolase-like domain-containing protein [Microbacterium sp. C7(2022)]MDE0546616.1 DUF1593 domain-containing protein [Microbacterium sp. C7(2022)]